MSIQKITVVENKTLLGTKLADGFKIYPVSRIDGKKGKSGFSAIAPALSAQDIERISQSVEGELEIRKLFEAVISRMITASHKSGQVLDFHDVDFAAVISQLRKEAELASPKIRLSVELIEKWFDSEVADLLKARLLEVTPEISGLKVAKVLRSFKTEFTSISAPSGVKNLDVKIKEQLLKVLELLPEDSENPVTIKISEKLAEENPEEEILPEDLISALI